MVGIVGIAVGIVLLEAAVGIAPGTVGRTIFGSTASPTFLKYKESQMNQASKRPIKRARIVNLE